MATTAAATTTVRVDARTHQRLTSLATASGKSMQAIMAEAVEAYYRHDMLERTNAAYAALRADPVAWAELEAERQIWDGTLMDGLEDKP